MRDFRKELFEKSDNAYKKFHSKIVPDTHYEIIGVRLPEVRKIAKSAGKEDINFFLGSKQRYYEEYLLRGLFIAKIEKDDATYALLEDFLPAIDNWAICDCVASSVKKLAKDKKRLYNKIATWLKSDKTYTVRFALVCLLCYFVNDEYVDKILDIASSVKSDEYYINMAVAWLISVVLVKNYGAAVALLESKTLPTFIQNKAIDKARDSFRISNDKKTYLKKLKK